MRLSKEDLIDAAYEIMGGSVKDLSLDQIHRLMTITQYVTDVCFNETVERGEPTIHDGMLVVPYCSDYSVNILNGLLPRE